MIGDKQEIMYNLVMHFIGPILSFADFYITKDGYISQVGGDPDEKIVIKEDEIKKVLVLPKNDYALKWVKDRSDEFIIFNPFKNIKHFISIVADAVRVKLVEIYGNEDHRGDDLLSVTDNVPEDDSIIELIQIPRSVNLDDDHGFENKFIAHKRLPNEKEIASAFHMDPIIAMWAVCFKVYVIHSLNKKTNDMDRMTRIAVSRINAGLTKYMRTKMAQENINNLDLVEDEVYEAADIDILEIPDEVEATPNTEYIDDLEDDTIVQDDDPYDVLTSNFQEDDYIYL